MTPRDARQQIAAIDNRLAVLAPHIATLTNARQRHLLDGSADSLDAISVIERGIPRHGGRLDDPDLDGFDHGLPGLHAAQQEVTTLRERRQLLVHQLPSVEQTAAATREAITQAATIATQARALDDRTAVLRSMLAGCARHALGVADDAWQFWVANANLDAWCKEADIPRPATPRPEAPSLPSAIPLGVLLSSHCSGGRPMAVDDDLRRDLLAALKQGDAVLAD
jgi:hypothetical protein